MFRIPFLSQFLSGNRTYRLQQRTERMIDELVAWLAEALIHQWQRKQGAMELVHRVKSNSSFEDDLLLFKRQFRQLLLQKMKPCPHYSSSFSELLACHRLIQALPGLQILLELKPDGDGTVVATYWDEEGERVINYLVAYPADIHPPFFRRSTRVAAT